MVNKRVRGERRGINCNLVYSQKETKDMKRATETRQSAEGLEVFLASAQPEEGQFGDEPYMRLDRFYSSYLDRLIIANNRSTQEKDKGLSELKLVEGKIIGTPS